MDDPDFRVLFEASPAPMVALRPDSPRFTIAAVSDAYARATMTRRDQILGRGLFDVFPDNPDDPRADGVRKLGASLDRVLATGAPDVMAVQKHDVQRPPEQGGGFEPRWWSPVNSAAFGADGRIAYLLHRVEDVTDLVRLKQRGAEQDRVATRSEEYWHGLFEQVSEGIVIVDPDLGCIEANEAACALLGRRREQLVGSGFDALLAPGHRQREAFEACRSTADRAVHRHPWTLLRGDGGVVAVDASVRRLSDDRCLVLLHDATERRQRERLAQQAADELERRVVERTEQLRRLAAELEAAEIRERRQLARDLHDDLGQTLAAARIRLDALCRDAQPEVRAAAAEIAAIVSEANRATRSLAAQLAPAVLYELGLAAALEWLAEEVEAQFGLVVTITDDGAPKPLSTEARSIVYRAVRELLINVAKHAAVRSAAVRLERHGAELRVRVDDAGVGFLPMPAGSARRGLGLASVRERLAFIGGRFEIRSVPGDGTEALLHVPLLGTAPTCAPMAHDQGSTA